MVGSDDMGDALPYGPLQPLPEVFSVEQYLRLEALKLALGTGDPDSALTTENVLKTAETFFRYILSGATPNANVVDLKPKAPATPAANEAPKCQYCGHIFVTNDALWDHLDRVHPRTNG